MLDKSKFFKYLLYNIYAQSTKANTFLQAQMLLLLKSYKDIRSAIEGKIWLVLAP